MTWETDILGGLSAPTTANNIAKLDAWNKCEGNAPRQSGLPINNPFNTTLSFGGGVSVNSAGVKWYPSWQTGLAATLQTLQSSYYSGIVTNLRMDGPGQQFANAVGNSPWGTSGSCISSTIGSGPAAGDTPGGGTGSTVANGNVQYTYAQLECVWNQAGGNAQAAPMAAAIAMAESSGNAAAANYDSNGTVDRGLWQINSVHGAQSSFDVMTNARAAVAISNNGSNWGPWTTFNTGAYQKYLQPNITPDCTAPINGTNAAANSQNATLAGCSFWEQVISPGMCLGQSVIGGSGGVAGSIVNGIVGSLINPLIQITAGILGISGGLILMIGGAFLIVRQTETYQQVQQTGQQGAGMMAWLAGPEAGAAEEAAGSSAGAKAGIFGRGKSQPQQPQPPTPQQQLRNETTRYVQTSQNYRSYQASYRAWLAKQS